MWKFLNFILRNKVVHITIRMWYDHKYIIEQFNELTVWKKKLKINSFKSWTVGSDVTIGNTNIKAPRWGGGRNFSNVEFKFKLNLFSAFLVFISKWSWYYNGHLKIRKSNRWFCLHNGFFFLSKLPGYLKKTLFN